jgi:hypothetical protein
VVGKHGGQFELFLNSTDIIWNKDVYKSPEFKEFPILYDLKWAETKVKYWMTW